jgi:hypothetical protein
VSRGRAAVVALTLGAGGVVGIIAHPADAARAVECHGRRATIVGTPGDDVLEGTGAADVINGRGGADTIRARGGADLICGGAGNDVINGGPGKDEVWGGSGNDVVRGGGNNDRILAGRGNDRVWGNAGQGDFVAGGIGSDVCVAEAERSCELDSRWGHEPEEWRPLLRRYFGDVGETANALRIVACESNGEPFAANPEGNKPRGLFQFIRSTWQTASAGAGWGQENEFHPQASIAAARWLFDAYEDDGRWGWDPWTHCRCLLPDSGCRFGPDVRHQTSDIRHQTPDTRHQ